MIARYLDREGKNLMEIKKTYFYIAFILIIIFVGIYLAFTLGKPTCGDSICEANENCYDCPKDCKCVGEEYCSAEEKRCIKPSCGDGSCDSEECSSGCTADCSLTDCCGIEGCNPAIGENCSNCPKDCGTCPLPSVCGNNICEYDENCYSCSSDCKCKSGEVCSKEKKICVKETKQKVCGDSICEANENCYDCPKDCKCVGEEYCSAEEKRCIKPSCGDGSCEPYETPYNCCLDCKCSIPAEICNEKTKKCEMQEMNLSDARAVELSIEYFENQDMEVNSTKVIGVSVYNEKLIKQVKVQISGETGFRYVGVTEEEEVIELPII